MSKMKSWSVQALLLALSLIGCRKDHEHEEEIKTIKVAALLSQTGGWSN